VGLKKERILILSSGKLVPKELKPLQDQYLERLGNFNIKTFEIGLYQDQLSEEKNLNLKINELAKSYQNLRVFLLRENGQHYSSHQFAHWLNKGLTNNERFLFVISSQRGFTQEFIELYPNHFSLSLLTFPHKIVSTILVEQIYRAETIIENRPYHY